MIHHVGGLPRRDRHVERVQHQPGVDATLVFHSTKCPPDGVSRSIGRVGLQLIRRRQASEQAMGGTHVAQLAGCHDKSECAASAIRHEMDFGSAAAS